MIVLGANTAFRLRLDRAAGRLVLDERWRPRYGPSPGRSYGWDPVIAEHHVLWMDNGRNHTDRAMLGTGSSPDPVRLWWVRHDDERSIRSVEISGLPYGTESNPPAWDHVGGVVVAYDAGNAVLRAWRLAGEELEPLWQLDGFAHAGHLIVFPDTRELIAGDWHDRGTPANRRVRRVLSAASRPVFNGLPSARRAVLRLGHDELVVLDLDTGAEKARVAVPSPMQGFLFPAPGFGRDIYYQSLSTIARIEVVS